MGNLIEYAEDFTELLNDVPDVVRARAFHPDEFNVPYGRRQRPEEMADWLSAAGYMLAPATPEVMAAYPSAAWMSWPANWPYALTGSLGLLLVVDDLAGIMQEHHPTVVDSLAREAFETALREALQDGGADVFDATRAWLSGPEKKAALVPDVLLMQGPGACRNTFSGRVMSPEEWSPARWRHGACLSHIHARETRESPYPVREAALRVLLEEEHRLLDRLEGADGSSRRQRL
ncbi:hypothetical protein [Luteibacter aegosomatissinici]|uniref:hypothetical protein n=1 Tax=Luteibacter aegosomatissinici TaxID=2911539 RepID=UPI001FF8E759|nr:hypothetical protein [Luteibacter aegosomatissinici]UPG92865.1 hypothetical protein L2Y97_13420 [Luteibacter aegosomatissinici]